MPDRGPVEEGDFGLHDVVIGLGVGKRCCRIVIRLVPCFLQLEKCLRDVPNLLRERLPGRCRIETCRVVGHPGIFLTYGSHHSVIKSPPHPRTQRGDRDQLGSRLVDQEVEQGVVGRRHAAPQISLNRCAWIAAHQVPGQGQQVLVQRHGSVRSSGLVLDRRAHPDVRPPLDPGRGQRIVDFAAKLEGKAAEGFPRRGMFVGEDRHPDGGFPLMVAA
jgi:hypothetical protein